MSKLSYALSDFARLPEVRKMVADDLHIGDLPKLDEVKALAKWTPELLDKFGRSEGWFSGAEDGQKKDRSAAMSELAYLTAELGWSDPQIAAALYDADDRWGKYKKRHDRQRRITDFVNRARQKYGYNVAPIDFTSLIKSANQSTVQEGESKLVYGFDEFVEADFKIEWMLDGLLAQGGLGLLTGYAGTGKTQLAIALGAHMALGRPQWLKWDNNTGAKKVLFLSLEMSAAPLNLFMGTIGKAYPDKRTLNRNFLVAPFGTPLPLDTPEGQQFLDKLMTDHMPDLVIIDSLQKVVSKELTDEQAVKSLIHYLSTVRKQFNCSMLIIHHNRKKPNDAQKKSGVELSDVYGSTYITTDVDFVLSLKAQENSLLMVDSLKNRLGATLDPFEVARNPDDLSFSTDLTRLHEQFRKDNGNAPAI